MIRLFVDDWRRPPTQDWKVARTYLEAVAVLEGGDVEWLSLDYDLESGPNGMDVCAWLVDHGAWPNCIWVHSDHQAGRAAMLSTLRENAPAGVQIVD